MHMCETFVYMHMCETFVYKHSEAIEYVKN